MYYPAVRFCKEPSRAKYALCLITNSGHTFIRSYTSYERYKQALAAYLSKPDWFAVSYVKYRGNWVYSSISHTRSCASLFVLDAARETAAAFVASYLR